jgi:hypothetical protein
MGFNSGFKGLKIQDTVLSLSRAEPEKGGNTKICFRITTNGIVLTRTSSSSAICALLQINKK